MKKPDRRKIVLGAAAASLLLSTGGRTAIARVGDARAGTRTPKPIRVALVAVRSGLFARCGIAMTVGFRLRLQAAGDRLGGRPVELIDIDSHGDPQKTVGQLDSLLRQRSIDLLVGSLLSPVARSMAKLAQLYDVPLIIPHACDDELTGLFCRPLLFRTSFCISQLAGPCAEAVRADGHHTASMVFWDSLVGRQAAATFQRAFEGIGGTVLDKVPIPFPRTDFALFLDRLHRIGPEAVFAAIFGPPAIRFVTNYTAAGPRFGVPLYGPGCLTEMLGGAGHPEAEGVKTASHYAQDLDFVTNHRFRSLFRAQTGTEPDLYGVHGHDAADLLVQGLATVNGDLSDRHALAAALEAVTIDSPRGPFRLSPAHNPIHTVYVREVKGGYNRLLRVAARKVDDPATGCRYRLS